MFSFFTKKHFLIDHLEGFIDIHNHILPGIDDGAKNVDESIKLLKGFGEFGVTDFICTPHIMENYYPNTPATIANALALLENGLKMNNLDHVHIEVAAEHMIDANFEVNLENNQVMPMNKFHLLVEMSYLQPPINFDKAISKTTSKQFFPILAHPERYNFLHKTPKKYTKFKEQGIRFQMNMLSLGDFYGKEVQRVALKLLEERQIDFLASDIHNQKQLKALKNITLPQKNLQQILPVINNTIETFT